MLPVIQYIRPLLEQTKEHFKKIPTKTEAGYPTVRSGVGNKIFWRFGYREIEQENFIVMQYTGLKDKNRVEIYEGDIVVEGYKGKYGTYEVKWDKIGFNLGSEDGRDYEVIGSIYENPELLERENK